jgi:flavin reductase (DIM6/NTAB) family NADH-FMN oxidoreductase RutF
MNDEWITALGKMTYGIYVLTTSYKDEINGMIASWVSQISYEPLLIMVAVHPNRYSYHLLEQSGCFVLHVLGKDQANFLSRFKGSVPEDKFAGIQWQRGPTGCPVLKDCLAYFECELRSKYAPGNHALFVGEVITSQNFAGDEPLSTLDYDGVYQGRS